MAKYVKPTKTTKFHIDFNWWKQKGRNLRSYLLEHLCDDYRNLADADTESKTIDWVDPDTGQVFAVDRLWYTIRSHCSQNPDFIPDNLTLTASIFRLFIANNNTPLTPAEMHQQLRRKTPILILRTIGGHTIYKGIRPATVPVNK